MTVASDSGYDTDLVTAIAKRVGVARGNELGVPGVDRETT